VQLPKECMTLYLNFDLVVRNAAFMFLKASPSDARQQGRRPVLLCGFLLCSHLYLLLRVDFFIFSIWYISHSMKFRIIQQSTGKIGQEGGFTQICLSTMKLSLDLAPMLFPLLVPNHTRCWLFTGCYEYIFGENN
jgi:hypothetical protein